MESQGQTHRLGCTHCNDMVLHDLLAANNWACRLLQKVVLTSLIHMWSHGRRAADVWSFRVRGMPAFDISSFISVYRVYHCVRS
jgi:hypothetical protein